MPSDPAPFAIHATAVAIGDRGLVIRGASKAGKSTLALRLIAATTPELPIMLVGDDRVLVSRRGHDTIVAPHPRIAGLIEQRGAGILTMPYRTGVPMTAIVDLEALPATEDGCASRCDFAGQNFPSLRFVVGNRLNSRHARVLEWFAATSAAQCSLKCGLKRLHA